MKYGLRTQLLTFVFFTVVYFLIPFLPTGEPYRLGILNLVLYLATAVQLGLAATYVVYTWKH